MVAQIVAEGPAPHLKLCIVRIWRTWLKFNLMRAKSKKIEAHFSTYTTFLSDKKTIEQEEITLRLNTKQRRKEGESAIIYAVIQGKKRFEAIASSHVKNKYQFYVFADWFDAGPCFRFDSQGQAHCNPEDGRGLKARKIETPHFHKFNKDGVEIAFHSAELQRPSAAEAIVNDIKSGIKHFCQEGCLTCGQNAYPRLISEQELMDLSSDDPLNDVSFL